MGFKRFCIAIGCVAAAASAARSQSITARAQAPATRPATVQVAAVQCPSDLGDVAANRIRLTALVEQAAAHGAKIIVLPEASITGYLSQDLKTNWHVAGKPMAFT